MANFEPCKHRTVCGGCKYNGMVYEETLAAKDKEVRECLCLHGVDLSCYKGVIPAKERSRYGYRNKMEYTFGDLVKGGEMTLGMHKTGSFMSIITVDDCQLVADDFNVILRQTLDFCISNDYMHYHKKTHEGLLRNLIVRKGMRTGELLINIVTSSEDGFDEIGFMKMILSLKLEGTVVGILRTLNDRLADAVYCDKMKVLFGRNYYYEVINGLRFKVNAFSFFQTNVEAVERMYDDAVSLLKNINGKTLFDLYCGTGTISQIAAKSAAKVIGIELAADSVEAAKANAILNGIKKCEFICGDVFETLDGVSEHPDVIIVDPPRIGMREKAVSRVASYGVPEIVYISCNPKTCAADLEHFISLGYEPVTIQAYDNFVWTRHVETVALLSKLDVDKHIDVEIKLDELDLTSAESKATYAQIKEYILEKFDLKVSTLYIAQIKKKCGIVLREHYNKSKKEKQVIPQCTPEKEEAIMDALRHFKMI